MLVILALVVIILSLLGVSLSALFQNKVLRENFSFIGNIFDAIWNSWLGRIVNVVWNFAYNFFTDFIWGAFIDAMNAIKAGKNPI